MTVKELLEAGVAHHRAGRLAEAENSYRQVLAREPDQSAALHFLGLLVAGAGRGGEGLELLRRAVAISPDNPTYYSNLGNVLAERKRFDEAVACYRRAIELKPDFAGAHNNLGGVFKDTGRLNEAVGEFREALRLRPDMAEAYVNLGDVLTEKGELDEAIACLRRSIELNPSFARGHSNLGVALQRSGEIDRAIECYREAIRIDPGFAKAHNNLGIALREQGQVDSAIAACAKAVELSPDSVDAHWSLALALLLAGDLTRGLPEYEWRWKRNDLPWKRRTFAEPQWDGGPLLARTLLVHAEQGLGDTIQFMRFVPLIEQVMGRGGGKVVVECQPDVTRLVRENLRGIDVLEWDQSPGTFDVQCPLMSLPLILGTSLSTIPAPIPHIVAQEDLVQKWAQRIAGVSGLKIGIAWAGSARHPLDRERSIALSELAPLAEVGDVVFYSLQKERPAVVDSAEFQQMRFIDYTAELTDFMDTAALVANLDLVISVDTAIAHLAGAMGKPTWMMLPFAPDWRWMLGRADSPWYPTMRLFRQKSRGDWRSVVGRVAEALGKFAQESQI